MNDIIVHAQFPIAKMIYMLKKSILLSCETKSYINTIEIERSELHNCVSYCNILTTLANLFSC